MEESDYNYIDPSLNLTKKADCNADNVYCFDNDDCIIKCEYNGFFSCVAGKCVTETIIEKQVETLCDATKGLLSFLVGDPQRGVYDEICLSVDPGIAKRNGENVLCKVETSSDGSDLLSSLDYRSKFPAISECVCPDDTTATFMPGTSTIRPSIACVNSNLYKFFNLN